MYKPSSHSSFDIYRQDNMVRLEDPTKIHDTTLLEGAIHSEAGSASKQHGIQNYFTGYVFRGDIKPPEIIFQAGFAKIYSDQPTVHSLTAGSSGRRMKGGVSTTICVQVAGWFTIHGVDAEAGYVYLIDASEFKGIAVAETPQSALGGWFPHLTNGICDVNFTHAIPNTSIVGVVWPDKYYSPEESCWRSAPATALSLAINPEYEKGIKGVQKVKKLFSVWG